MFNIRRYPLYSVYQQTTSRCIPWFDLSVVRDTKQPRKDNDVSVVAVNDKLSGKNLEKKPNKARCKYINLKNVKNVSN